MTAPIPPHGTPARYHGNSTVEPCRCQACTKATSRHALQCAVERLAGNPRRVPIGPVWAHVLMLRDAGLNDAEIARAAMLPHSDSVAKLGKQKTVGRNIARAVLAIPLDYWEKPDTVPALGATRRIQALMVRGHSGATIAARANTEYWRIPKLTSGQQERISRRLDAAIRDVYRQLQGEPGTCKKAATIAARNGWHGPDTWGDIDDPTEDPNAVIRLNAFQLNKERSDEIRHLASAGETPERIAERLGNGLTPAGVRQCLRRFHHTLYLELTA